MATEYKKMDIEEMRKIVTDKREALRVFRFESQGSRSRNVREGRNMRRDVARALTELREQTLTVQAGIASKAKKA